MAHIIIDKTSRCTCDQASTCALTHKSGSMPRCTAEELEEAGHTTVSLERAWIHVLFGEPKYTIKTKKEIHNL